MLFFNIIFPVFFTALVGFVYARIADCDIKSINHITLNVLIPALVFVSLIETDITGHEVGQIAAFSVLLAATISGLVLVFVRLLRLNRERTNALLLTSVFMNTGNYGLPVVLYAIGEAGFARAVIFVIIQALLVYSLGVYFAAAGRLDARRALLAIVKLPTFYAAAFGLIFRALSISVPEAILDPLSTMGDASIIVMLLALGMQLAQVEVKLTLTQLSLASVIRLVVSPLVGVVLVRALGMAPVTAKTMIIEAAMPTAVITSLLALEFGSAPGLVSSTVFATTTLSFISVSVVLMFIM